MHDDHLNEISNFTQKWKGISLAKYVQVEPAVLDHELEVYTKKLREGKHVYGVEGLAAPPIQKPNNSRVA